MHTHPQWIFDCIARTNRIGLVMRRWTFYWHTGRREVLEGTDEDDAFAKGGYTSQDLERLDFIISGNDHRFTWNGEEWIFVGPNPNEFKR